MATARRRWQPAATFSQPITLKNAIPHLPRTYIYCTRASAEDRFGPYAQRARADPTWRYFELDANHIPNVTAPEALVELIVDKCLT